MSEKGYPPTKPQKKIKIDSSKPDFFVLEDLDKMFGSSNKAWALVEDCLTNIRTHEKEIDELKNVYNREKLSIEAKVQSVTQFKNAIVKNTRIENKIATTDNTIDLKLKTYDEDIRLNEERRERDIRVIRENYQSRMETLERKMKVEIDAVEARCDKYGAYLKGCKKQLEAKKDCVIRDLSCNIIPTQIGDAFDEDAYPRLTKLKYDIKVREDKLTELRKLRDELKIKYDEAYQRNVRENQAEAKRQERELKRQEEDEKQRAIERLQTEREAQKQADLERWERQKQERIAQEQAKQHQSNWIKTVYSKLPKEYQEYNCLFDKEQKEQMKALDSVEDVIEYMNTFKPQLTKLKELDDLYKGDSKHFKDEVWDKFYKLTFKQRLDIAQMNKPAQIIHINKYYSEVPKEESESESECED